MNSDGTSNVLLTLWVGRKTYRLSQVGDASFILQNYERLEPGMNAKLVLDINGKVEVHAIRIDSMNDRTVFYTDVKP